MILLTQHNTQVSAAERWHGEVEALEDALLATVLEQEAKHEGLEPEQVLAALADVTALLVLAQPAKERQGMMARMQELMRLLVLNESVHEGAAVGRSGVN